MDDGCIGHALWRHSQRVCAAVSGCDNGLAHGAVFVSAGALGYPKATGRALFGIGAGHLGTPRGLVGNFLVFRFPRLRVVEALAGRICGGKCSGDLGIEVFAVDAKGGMDEIFDSKTIKPDEVKTLKNWIGSGKSVSFELIYRATKDGFDSTKFHEKCDN